MQCHAHPVPHLCGVIIPSHRMEIGETLASLSGQGRQFALAVVLNTSGSTPCKPGAKAIIGPHGLLHGTVGGGLAEAEACRRALQALHSGQSEVFEFIAAGSDAGAPDPICGGAMRILIDPGAARHHTAFLAAEAARQRRERGLLLFTITRNAPPHISVEYLPESDLARASAPCGPKALRELLDDEEPAWIPSPRTGPEQPMECYAEPQIPKPVLIIAGGGHVGQAVAAQAGLAGFEIVVVDDRPEFTRQALFPPGTRLHCGDPVSTLQQIGISSDTYVVIVTRGHRHDADVLAACLNTPAAYIGMIGSRRKVALLRKDFLETGKATAAQMDRVYAPIGLDIGAVTVPEIALSIAAQLVAVRRKSAASRIPIT